jgi:hypothetical protein
MPRCADAILDFFPIASEVENMERLSDFGSGTNPCCSRTPTMGSAASNHAASMLATHNKSALCHVGYHGDTLGAIQHLFRDAFIGRSHDLVHNLAGRL